VLGNLFKEIFLAIATCLGTTCPTVGRTKFAVNWTVMSVAFSGLGVDATWLASKLGQHVSYTSSLLCTRETIQTIFALFVAGRPSRPFVLDAIHRALVPIALHVPGSYRGTLATVECWCSLTPGLMNYTTPTSLAASARVGPIGELAVLRARAIIAGLSLLK